MGNCLEHVGVYKAVTGHGGLSVMPTQNDNDRSSVGKSSISGDGHDGSSIGKPAISGDDHEGSSIGKPAISGDQKALSDVDISNGLELQLENVDSCRLSSTTAADLLSKITNARRAPTLEVLPSHQEGIWKVKLVITAEQLSDILSHESNTDALIRRMSSKAAHAKSTSNSSMNAERSAMSATSSSESCQTRCLEAILGHHIADP